MKSFENYQEVLKNGQEAFDDKKFDEAIKHFDECRKYAESISDSEKLTYAEKSLGCCYFEKEDFDEAIEHFEKFRKYAESISDSEKLTDAEQWLGLCYLEKKEFDKAIKHFEASKDYATTISDEQKKINQQCIAENWQGRCYFEKKGFDEAIKLFEASKDYANTISDKQKKINQQCIAEWWLGLCYLEKAGFDEAIKHFKALKNYAESISDSQKLNNAENCLGRCYRKKREFDKAIKHFEASKNYANVISNKQEKKNEQYIAESWLGGCYFEKEDFDEAIKHFEKLKNYAESSDSQKLNNAENFLGRCYFEKKDFDKAIEHFEKLDNAKHWLSRCYLEKKDFDEAIKHLKKIDEPYIAEYWLGRCYFEKKKFDEAISHFEKSMEFSQKIRDKKLMREYQHSIVRQLWFCCVKNNKYSTYLKYKKLFIKSNLGIDNKCILDILSILTIFPYEFKANLAHYTTPKVTSILLGFEKDKKSTMRLNSGNYMNDPMEGKVLSRYLRNTELSDKYPLSEQKIAFFTCFSKRINNLNQFRLYGKEEGIEASGCCIVMKRMDKWMKKIDLNNSFMLDKAESVTLPSSREDFDIPLYQVAYIANNDSKNGEEIFLSDLGDEGYSQFRLRKINKYFKSLKTEMIKKKDFPKDELEYVKYLFKDAAFKDEEEFRMLRVVNITSKEIKLCEFRNSLYLEYKDITKYIDEIILGTSFEKANNNKNEVFAYKINKKYPKIKVSQSTLPINS